MERKVHSGCHGGREDAYKWRLRVERMAYRVYPGSRGPETLARPQLGEWVGLALDGTFVPFTWGEPLPRIGRERSSYDWRGHSPHRATLK